MQLPNHMLVSRPKTSQFHYILHFISSFPFSCRRASVSNSKMPIQRKGMRALQIWCARVTSGYASVEVTDLTSSFRSGLAFVGIIHHFRPDLIQSPDSLDPKDVVGNNALAYRYEFNTCENLSSTGRHIRYRVTQRVLNWVWLT